MINLSMNNLIAKITIFHTKNLKTISKKITSQSYICCVSNIYNKINSPKILIYTK